MNTPRKRFIAGATCPACQTLDGLYVIQEDQQEALYCHYCDYVKTQDGQETGNQTSPAQTVKWVSRRKKTPRDQSNFKSPSSKGAK